MYNLFLKFLEEISFSLQGTKTELIFVLVPTNKEKEIYSKRNSTSIYTKRNDG